MRKILFLSGTRADYGKLKPLIREASTLYDVTVFATGMHMLGKYGLTVNEITRNGFRVHPFINQDKDDPLARIVANTIHGLSLYVSENPPDLLVIHGDRVEALAGAIVGNFSGILTAHVEGGELSGTVDGMIRHSVTKLAHVHFVANADALHRLVSMGENPETIYPIGSPDIDVMLGDLPDMEEVRKQYPGIPDEYGILSYHPVVGEQSGANFVRALRACIDSDMKFLVIYPNNDPGSQDIIRIMEEHRDEVSIIPSMRFEYYLTALKNAKVLVGNSSAGIREAPVYGVPSIDVGTRQTGRIGASVHAGDSYEDILAELASLPVVSPSLHYGKGDSAKRFIEILSSKSFWETPRQKVFWEGEQ